MEPLTDLSIRWMIRRDLPQVVSIERMSFGFPWDEDNFVTFLNQRNGIGLMATSGTSDTVVGFILYELHKRKFVVMNFAVHEAYRRRGVGRSMFDKLKGKLNTTRTSIELNCGEWNLPAQLFLRSIGVRATSVLKDYWISYVSDQRTSYDAYRFEYRRNDASRAMSAARS